MRGAREDLKALGARIRYQRERRGHSLADFAPMIGVATACLGAWERGERDPGIGGLLRLAGEFGIPAHLLLGERLESPFSPAVERIAEQIAELAEGRRA